MPQDRPKMHPLFIASKPLSREALAVYRNTSTFYILPDGYLLPYLSGIGSAEPDRYCDPEQALSPVADRFRHLSIAFDPRVVPFQEFLVHGTITERDWDAEIRLDQGANERRRRVHEWLVMHQLDLWETCVQSAQCQNLKTLEVNLQNCCCECGCQSLVERMVRYLCDWPGEEHRVPDAIRFSGTRGDEERGTIKDTVAARLGTQVKVVFAGSFVRVNRDGMNEPMYEQLVPQYSVEEVRKLEGKTLSQDEVEGDESKDAESHL